MVAIFCLSVFAIALVLRVAQMNGELALRVKRLEKTLDEHGIYVD